MPGSFVDFALCGNMPMMLNVVSSMLGLSVSTALFLVTFGQHFTSYFTLLAVTKPAL